MSLQDAVALLLESEALLSRMVEQRTLLAQAVASEKDRRHRIAMTRIVNGLLAAEQSAEATSGDAMRLLRQAYDLGFDRRTAARSEAMLAADNQ